MSLFTTLLLALPLLSISVQAAANATYAACQYPASKQGTQLQHCPNGTIYVSQTDPQATFGSIQGELGNECPSSQSDLALASLQHERTKACLFILDLV